MKPNIYARKKLMKPDIFARRKLMKPEISARRKRNCCSIFAAASFKALNPDLQY